MLQLVAKQHQCDQIKFCQLLKFSPHNLLDQLIHIFLSLNNETIGHKNHFQIQSGLCLQFTCDYFCGFSLPLNCYFYFPPCFGPVNFVLYTNNSNVVH